jgi:hypothetical protein
MDSYEEDEVEVVVAHHDDGWRLWVNVGGTNRLRIYRIAKLNFRGDVLAVSREALQ